MQRHKVSFIAFILILVISSHAYTTVEKSNVAWTPGMAISTSYYAAIPIAPSLSQNESLPLRSQWASQLNATVASMRINSTAAGIDLAVQYVSRSLYWGDTFYRPFWGIGPQLTIQLNFTDIFGLQVAGNLMYHFNNTVHQAFASISATVAPTFSLQVTNHNWLMLYIPISAQYRKDILGLQIGIGARWNYDSTSRKGK